MSNPTVGYAAVQIVPSARGFKAALNKEISPDLKSAGEKSGKEFGTGLKSAARKAGSDAGDVTAKSFRERFSGQLSGLGDELKTALSSPFAAGALVAGAGIALKSVVSEASNLEESINAVQVTFGSASDKILDFGKNAATSVGLAKSEFNELATPLGSILKNAGFDLDTTADKTILLTQRAADMASVFNTDVSESLSAIQAGLRGEQDPLERFGVSLSAAKVEARALADSGKESAKQLTDQEKQLARVNIILEQTNQTAGDFVNTSGSLANQTRTLKAEFKNLQASAGKLLIPVLSDVAEVLLAVGDAVGFAKDKIDDIPGGGDFLNKLFSGIPDIADEALKHLRDLEEGLGFPKRVDIGPLREQFNQMVAAGNAANDVVDKQGNLVEDLGQRWGGATIPLEGATGAFAEMRSQADLAADAVKDTADAADRSEGAHKLLADAIKAVRDAMFDSLDTMFDYEQSTAATFFAARDFKEALENTPDDLWAVREAEIAAAEAALKQSEDFATAAGATEDGTLKAQLMKDELGHLQEKFPELSGIIQGYIDKLNQIPGVVTTQLLITAEGRGFTAQLTGASGRIVDATNGFDSGGVVGGPLGSPQLAMVHGGETILATHKEGASGGFGGAGIQVTIEGPVYGHMLPEMIIDGVTQAARQNGSQWLRDLVDA